MENNAQNTAAFALVNRLDNKITKTGTLRAVTLAGKREECRVYREFGVSYHGAVVELRLLPDTKRTKGAELTEDQLKKAHRETGEAWGVWYK